MTKQDSHSWIYSFIYGFSLPMESARLLISRPRLIFWSILPITITLIGYYFLYSTLDGFFQGVTEQILTKWDLESQRWLATSIRILFKIVLFIFGGLSFSWISTILACPFNDFLAEATEEFSSPPLPHVNDPRLIFRLKVIGIDLVKSTFAAVVQLVSLFVSWLPLLNVMALLLTVLLICFQFVSYPQTRRGLGTWDGLLFLKQYFFCCLGFGSITALLFSIPFLSFLFLPLAVVGGTLLFARCTQNHRSGLPALK